MIGLSHKNYIYLCFIQHLLIYCNLLIPEDVVAIHTSLSYILVE